MIIKEEYYRIPLTFGIKNVESNIKYAAKANQPSYVCVVDINVLANTYKDKRYKAIIQNALFNTCDGSFLAFALNLKYRKRFSSYNGPEIFKKFIQDNSYKQLLIGPSKQDFQLLKENLHHSNHLFNITLPFQKVEDFNYPEISDKINTIKPDFIWIMLGAPKQELFIDNIIKLVDKGVFFGTGAALNFYFNRINNREFEILGLRFIWLERIFLEPKKQLNRIFNFIKVLPRILLDA